MAGFSGGVLGPTSGLLLGLLLGLWAALDLVTLACWDRGPLRRTRRVAGLTVAQLALVVAALVLVNRQIEFWASWAELFG